MKKYFFLSPILFLLIATPASAVFNMADCLAQNSNDTAGCQQLQQQYNAANPTQVNVPTPTPTTPFTANPVSGASSASTPTTQTTSAQNCGAACNLGYTPLEPIPGITTSNGQVVSFGQLIGRIYEITIIIGALFSVLMLTVSGIRYMLSDVVTDKSKAIQRIKACIYGLVLIAASYLILNTINPRLLKFDLNTNTLLQTNVTGGTVGTNTMIGGSGTTGGGITAQTSVTVSSIAIGQSVNIYNGSTALDAIYNYNAQCRGTMHQTGGGTDSQGAYVTWTCQ